MREINFELMQLNNAIYEPQDIMIHLPVSQKAKGNTNIWQK